ncbi:helix-turn-helix domain-containing protein [Streptomyces coelicoflavus]|uniref:helix-turn-helix domain-containing protein n=1 Tax=Streptomyces coelicoflavus TaxID=285562 RepID=UPI003450C5F3
MEVFREEAHRLLVPLWQAVARRAGPGAGLRVLGAFTEAGEGLALHTLAARAGLPKSTTSRIAGQLTDVGALERLANGDFVVGLHLLDITSLAPRGH